MKLVSLGFTEGFYGKPRVDKELLKQHSEGLIALSACLAGEIPRKLTAGEYDSAKRIAQEYAEIFGKENFLLLTNQNSQLEQLEGIGILFHRKKKP